MKILFASSEVAPFSKVGGLADVVGSLPKALEKLGAEICIFTPLYGSINQEKFGIKEQEIRKNLSPQSLYFQGVAGILRIHR